MESLSRPVLALAELKVMDGRALQALTERLVCATAKTEHQDEQLGPWPGALGEASDATVLGLWRFAACHDAKTGAYRHVFTAAYARLARALEAQAEGPDAIAGSTVRVAMAIRSFPELKFEELFSERFLQRDRSGVPIGQEAGKDDRDVEIVRIPKKWSDFRNDAE
eukprot:Skav221731  [mRNA]  locus=scaffold542:399264:401857:- [translate_table: standard]